IRGFGGTRWRGDSSRRAMDRGRPGLSYRPRPRAVRGPVMKTWLVSYKREDPEGVEWQGIEHHIMREDLYEVSGTGVQEDHSHPCPLCGGKGRVQEQDQALVGCE